MYRLEQIERERLIWNRKPQLRLLKADYYAQIKAFLPADGRIVEIGSGCGGIKEFLPRSIASDIFPTPWVDLAMSAEQLPLVDGSVDALVGIDVLHHMEHPLAFFHETARVLRTGCRLILIDPYVSLGSWISWHFIHHEKCSMQEPFDFAQRYVAENNARATLWFDHHREAMASLIRPLAVEKVAHFDLFYYPMTGGFRSWSLIPNALAPAVLRLDRWLGRWMSRWFGYRILIVMRKTTA